MRGETALLVQRSPILAMSLDIPFDIWNLKGLHD